jgi:hypothetical protein
MDQPERQIKRKKTLGIKAFFDLGRHSRSCQVDRMHGAQR